MIRMASSDALCRDLVKMGSLGLSTEALWTPVCCSSRPSRADRPCGILFVLFNPSVPLHDTERKACRHHLPGRYEREEQVTDDRDECKISADTRDDADETCYESEWFQQPHPRTADHPTDEAAVQYIANISVTLSGGYRTGSDGSEARKNRGI